MSFVVKSDNPKSIDNNEMNEVKSNVLCIVIETSLKGKI